MPEQPVQIVTLTIDGKAVAGRADESVLEVARENGIFIPTLCAMEGLSVVGSCRLCMIEVAGNSRLLPACATRIQEGMAVSTATDMLQRYRRMILELLFSERNHICSICVANNNCELQALAARLGVDHVHFPYLFPKFQVDATHDRFISDNNRCILCTRCVRVCGEIEGAHTLDIMGRGIFARVISDLDQPWGDSETCTRCGKCVRVCPTGAIVEKGRPVSDRFKHRDFLPYLKMMREEDKE